MILIIFIALVFVIFVLCGENGCNKKCKNANSCPASVRCNARSKEQCSCFEDKDSDKEWEIINLHWKIKYICFFKKIE